MKTSASIAFAIGLMGLGYFISSGLKGIYHKEASVVVKGIGERVVKANHAVWTISFSSKGQTYQEAQKRYVQNMKDVEAFLESVGVLKEEIIIAAPSTSEEKEYDKNKVLKYVEHTITGKVTVSSPDVDKVAQISSRGMELLEKGVALTSNGWGANPRYLLTDLDAYRPDLLEQAVKSAKAIAEKFANDSGAEVGKILRADQGHFSVNSDLGGEANEEASIGKKIRVVSHLTYALEG